MRQNPTEPHSFTQVTPQNPTEPHGITHPSADSANDRSERNDLQDSDPTESHETPQNPTLFEKGAVGWRVAGT